MVLKYKQELLYIGVLTPVIEIKEGKPMKKQFEEKSIKEVSDIIADMSLMDDELIAKVFDDNIPATSVLLQTILSDDVEIVSAKGQYEMKNPLAKGRNIRLDILAKDIKGNYFNCEVQRVSKNANAKRARFHSAMIDARMLKSGQEFAKINDSYVIFITEKDYYSKGKPVYYIERKIDDEESFDDGSHIIYVNGSYNGDDNIGHLMSDLRNKSTIGFYNKEIENSVCHYKLEEGKSNMSEIVEKYAEKRAKEGRIEEKLKDIQALMQNLKCSAEQAMETLNVPKSEYNKYLSRL